MSLPTTITAANPAQTGVAPSALGTQLRALKVDIEDLFGIPDATAIAAAGFAWDANGLNRITVRDAGGIIHDINDDTAVIFNEQGANIDFRVEGDTNTTLFNLDAGQDAISFGGANIDGCAIAFNNLTDRTAITSVGFQIHVPAQTSNFDNGSGTIAVGAAVFVGIPTWTGDTATLTMTDAATVVIQGAPVDSTNVTGTTTHALLVQSGLSTFGGAVSVDDTTDTTSGITGSVHTDGGLGIAKALYVGTSITIGNQCSVANEIGIGGSIMAISGIPLQVYNPTMTAGQQTIAKIERQRVAGGGPAIRDGLLISSDGIIGGTVMLRSTGTNSQGLGLGPSGTELTVLSTGVTVESSLSVGTTTTLTGAVSVDDTTDTTSGITGSVHTDGGLGIAKALYVGTTTTLIGAVSVDDTTDTTSGTTGSVHTDGGLGIAKALYVGTTATLVGNVVIGATTANASAALQVDSTSQGFLLPRMSSAQRQAISTPLKSLLVYDNDDSVLMVYDGSVWANVGAGL